MLPDDKNNAHCSHMVASSAPEEQSASAGSTKFLCSLQVKKLVYFMMVRITVAEKCDKRGK